MDLVSETYIDTSYIQGVRDDDGNTVAYMLRCSVKELPHLNLILRELVRQTDVMIDELSLNHKRMDL